MIDVVPFVCESVKRPSYVYYTHSPSCNKVRTHVHTHTSSSRHKYYGIKSFPSRLSLDRRSVQHFLIYSFPPFHTHTNTIGISHTHTGAATIEVCLKVQLSLSNVRMSTTWRTRSHAFRHHTQVGNQRMFCHLSRTRDYCVFVYTRAR
jgi:hypothetical protein